MKINEFKTKDFDCSVEWSNESLDENQMTIELAGISHGLRIYCRKDRSVDIFMTGGNAYDDSKYLMTLREQK